MTDPSACRDWYFCPVRNDFSFGNKKKSQGARSGEIGKGGGGVRQNSYFFYFFFFQNAVTIAEV